MYYGWLPFLQLTELPFAFDVDMGHILGQHGYNEANRYVKSMFCWNLSHVDALRCLITFTFVAVCSGPNSNGPEISDPEASNLGYSIIWYRYPHGIGWSIDGKVARWMYAHYYYNGKRVYICQAWLS